MSPIILHHHIIRETASILITLRPHANTNTSVACCQKFYVVNNCTITATSLTVSELRIHCIYLKGEVTHFDPALISHFHTHILHIIPLTSYQRIYIYIMIRRTLLVLLFTTTCVVCFVSAAPLTIPTSLSASPISPTARLNVGETFNTGVTKVQHATNLSRPLVIIIIIAVAVFAVLLLCCCLCCCCCK